MKFHIMNEKKTKYIFIVLFVESIECCYLLYQKCSKMQIHKNANQNVTANME